MKQTNKCNTSHMLEFTQCKLSARNWLTALKRKRAKPKTFIKNKYKFHHIYHH